MVRAMDEKLLSFGRRWRRHSFVRSLASRLAAAGRLGSASPLAGRAIGDGKSQFGQQRADLGKQSKRSDFYPHGSSGWPPSLWSSSLDGGQM